MEMKYIVIRKGKEELMFTFPNEVWHSMFYDIIQAVKNNPGSSWERRYRGWECVAAGFIQVDPAAMCGVFCYGKSESIGVTSRGITDASLFNDNQGHKKC